MTTDVCQTVVASLQQEVEWVKALNDVLLKEKEALEHNQFEQLTTFAETKKTLSENLEKSTKNRLEHMQIDPNNPTAHKEAFQKFLHSLPQEQASTIQQLNAALSEQLKLCGERNTVNGQVIATNFVARKALVENLTSNADKDENQATYDSQGDVKKNPRSGNYQEV